jgi:hypothetical protein
VSPGVDPEQGPEWVGGRADATGVWAGGGERPGTGPAGGRDESAGRGVDYCLLVPEEGV